MSNLAFYEALCALANIQRDVAKSFHADKKDLLINATAQQVLLAIRNAPNSSMGEISAKIGLEKGSFTKIADTLIAYRLVAREQGEDRRTSKLSLTEDGKRIAELIARLLDDHIEKILSPLPKEDRTALTDAVLTAAKRSEELQIR